VVTRRSRVVRAPVGDVWAVLADPWHMPRWWPRTSRVEGVSDEGWTSVLASDRGHSVRADWAVETSEFPSRRRWVQELEGSPFARLFDFHAIEARLAPADGDATKVTLEIEQRVRGWARFAPFLVRRAMKRQADEALAGLEQAVAPS
jgi:uncharacterized protein YndB with AHSA1/START domain